MARHAKNIPDPNAPPPEPPPPPEPAPFAPVDSNAPPPAFPPPLPPERDSNGKFRNSKGRKPGSVNRDKLPAETHAAVQEIGPVAVDRLRILVEQGSFAAIKYVLDALLPKGGRTINLNGTSDPHQIITAVTSGTISPDEFARISQGIKTALDSAELLEIKSQIEELEQLVAAMRK